MSRALLLDILRTIRHTFSRFISLVVIVALGTGFFVGIKSAGPSMEETAKEYVFNTKKSISEVAYALGFQYPQHFSRWFKKQAGCTPNEYRAIY